MGPGCAVEENALTLLRQIPIMPLHLHRQVFSCILEKTRPAIYRTQRGAMPPRLSEERPRKEMIDPQIENAGWYLRNHSKINSEIHLDG
jgi:hypothetical protein